MESKKDQNVTSKTGGETDDKRKGDDKRKARKSERLTKKEERTYDAKLPDNKRALESDSESDSDSDDEQEKSRDVTDGVVDVYKEERFVFYFVCLLNFSLFISGRLFNL